MRTFALFTGLFLIFTGMGLSMSDCPKDDIMIPAENFEVEITDIDGVMTKGNNITFECQTYISAKRGSTTIFIPFDRIKEIKMLNTSDVITKKLPVINLQITLTDDSVYESEGTSHQELTGQASFGSFRIRLDHIKSIRFISMKKNAKKGSKPIGE